jgi:hypothetical protein
VTPRRHLIGAALLLAGGSLAAPAAAAPPFLTLTVATPTDHALVLTLTSRLEGVPHPAGKAVTFFVLSTEFGRHEVKIATARTAADGRAAVRYHPTWSGDERFVARVRGVGARVRAATASYSVVVSRPGPLAARANPGRPLASVGNVFLDTALTAVAVVWLVLIGMLVAAFAWMPRLAGRGTD